MCVWKFPSYYGDMDRDAAMSLLFRAKSGDRAAVDSFARTFMPLVEGLANGFHRKLPGLAADDLKQEGLLGLMRALKFFDPKRGVKLSTYVFSCVRRSMLMHIRSQTRNVPRTHATGSIEIGLVDDAPCPVEVCSRNQEIARVRVALKKVRRTVSDRGLAILNERLLSDEPKSLAALGKKFGVSHEMVRLTEKKLKALLQKHLPRD